MKKFIYLIISCCLLTSCKQINQLLSNDANSGEGKGKKLARVNETILYEADLDGILHQGMSAKDSTDITDRYVNSWVKKQVLFSEAEKNSVVDEAELERRVEDYKYQLLVYAFEKKYVETNLDSVVTDQEIQAYYDENLKDFILKSNIVRGSFLKFPKETPQLNNVKAWVKSSREEDLELLRSLAYSYADFAHLNNEVWLSLDDLLFGTPFAKDSSDKLQALKRNKFWSAEDGGYAYYFKIDEYKIVDEPSPLQFVKEQVRDIILNKRKIQLTKKLEKELFDKATLNKSYEVYQ